MADIPTYKLEFPYKRSLGPVVATFLTGLRDRQILGIKTQAGRVLVPPLEYDPDTGEENLDWVEVGQSGMVRNWTWVEKPGPKQPLDHGFAWALIQLDGADSSLVHAVDVGSQERLKTGMRVRARWAAETKGHISDIVCFEPEAD